MAVGGGDAITHAFPHLSRVIALLQPADGTERPHALLPVSTHDSKVTLPSQVETLFALLDIVGSMVRTGRSPSPSAAAVPASKEGDTGVK